MSRYLRIALLVITLLVAALAQAGGGPAGTLVIYDPDDVVSLAIANHYQRVRGIPERNMLPIAFPGGYNDKTIWDLVEQIRTEIDRRGLKEGLQQIALAGYMPLDSGIKGSGGKFSLASLLYMSPNYSRENPPKRESNTAFRKPPEKPTIALNAYTPIDGRSYWPVSHVGPTHHSALSLQAALASIDRAKAADGGKPDGVIYWPLNGDIRSKTRESQITEVTPLWDKLGIRYVVQDGVWVRNRGDIAGGVVGIAVTDTMQGNRYLPGAWVDHLTSFGGVLWGEWQMPCTDFILAGADGSAGTMGEPYAISAKFPHAHIYTHFRAGASLAEAFWESIGTPFEILPVGDPLMQPYAEFPKGITITAPKSGETIKGTVAISVSQKFYFYKDELPLDISLMIGNQKVSLGGGFGTGGTITNSQKLDTTKLADGWYEMRFVIANPKGVHTESEERREYYINNHGQSVTLTGPKRMDYAGTNRFTVALKGLADATGVTLRANGRTLATLPGAGTMDVPGKLFPCTGDCTLHAVAALPNGQEVWSAPLTVGVDWPAKPATTNPPFGVGMARLRCFADTTLAGFSWETTVPNVMGILPRGNSFTVTAGTPFEPTVVWEKVDFAKKPGIEMACTVYIPEDGIYEFGSEGSSVSLAGALRIDGQELPRMKNGLYGPVRLARGWHAALARAVVTKADFKWTPLLLRGGALGKLTAARPAWCATPGETKLAVTAQPVAAVTGKTAALQAAAPGENAYTWSVVSGPAVGTAHCPDEVAAVTFTPNSTAQSGATTATFTAPGSYLLRAWATAGQAAGYVDVPVTVQAVPTQVAVSAPAAAVQGYPVNIHAVTVDQFGRRIDGQPPVAWNAAPGGTIEKLSGESARFRPGTELGACAITATSGALNGKATMTIAQNQPPKLKQVSYNGVNDRFLQLNAQAEDPEDPRGAGMTAVWTVTKTPAGQTLELATLPYSIFAAKGKPSGPGTYEVRLTVTDIGGATTTETLILPLVFADNGQLIVPPRPNMTPALSGFLTTTVFLQAYGSGMPYTCAWETSADGGTTWTPLPGASDRPNVQFGPLTLQDNNRLFRVKATNAAASIVSGITKLTVVDPPGGLLVMERTVNVREDCGTASVIVHRTLHTKGKVTVKYTVPPIAGLTAAATGTLTWEDGDGADKTIAVPITKNPAKTGNKAFTVQINTPTGGAEITLGQCSVVVADLEAEQK
ncbi:MAG: TIGR03790 family protein [Armatimonadota bacterium]